MRDKIFRVGHAILLDVWPVGILRVGPPVIALGKEVVLSAGAPGAIRGGDGYGFLVQIFCRLCQDTRTLDLEEIELGAIRAEGRPMSGREQEDWDRYGGE